MPIPALAAPLPPNPTRSYPGERFAYAMLTLAFLAAMVPIGPAVPPEDGGAVAATCPGQERLRVATEAEACGGRDQVAADWPSAALRIAAMLTP